MSTTNASRPLALDPGRITAGAGTVALNAVVLMLLLVPVAVPPILERDTPPGPDVIWIEPRRPEPRPEPIEVEVRRSIPRPDVPPRPVERPVVQPPLPTTSEPQAGDIVVAPGDQPDSDATTHPVLPPDDGRPMEGAHLAYASAPPPPYPREALLDQLTGTVLLRVLVDVDGKPLEVSVQRSSGHRTLDAAARRQVLSRWRFNPAVRNGVPVQAIGVVPVEFRLD